MRALRSLTLSESSAPTSRASLAWPWGGPASPAAPDTETLTVEDEAVEERIDSPWRVILFNDEIHTFDEVIVQLVKATGCSESKAEGHAWTVHTRGKDTVYEGEFEDCFRVQGILREIQLVTEIQG